MNPTAETKKDQKRIIEVWCPGNGNSHELVWRVGEKGITEIRLINEWHGDYDHNWIMIEQGDITRKLNERQVTEVVWSKESTPDQKKL